MQNCITRAEVPTGELSVRVTSATPATPSCSVDLAASASSISVVVGLFGGGGVLIRHGENLQVRHLVFHHSGDSAICEFCDSNETYVATPSCDANVFVVFCRTARTVLLILFCLSDVKSQPLCDLVAICNCDFLRRDFGICDLKSLPFAIATAHILRSRMAPESTCF